MNDEQKKISEQFTRNFSEKEFLRFGCVFTIFLFVGIALGLIFHNAGIILIFVVLFHGIIWLAPHWQPAFNVVRKVMGNSNIPSALPKYQRKWWQYISIAIKIVVLFMTLRIGIQLLFK